MAAPIWVILGGLAVVAGVALLISARRRRLKREARERGLGLLDRL
jgi:LPXTG-motif cell wall-anchored protein